jgi:hypothetical protein
MALPCPLIKLRKVRQMDRRITIDNYDEHCPQLRIRFDGYEMSFTVKDVAPEAREWLGGVIERQVSELIALRVNQALDKHRADLRKLLGAAHG